MPMPSWKKITVAMGLAGSLTGTVQAAPQEPLPQPAATPADPLALPAHDAVIGAPQVRALIAAEKQSSSAFTFIEPGNIPDTLSPELLDRAAALGKQTGFSLDKMKFEYDPGDHSGAKPVLYDYKWRSGLVDEIMVKGDIHQDAVATAPINELPDKLKKKIEKITEKDGEKENDADPRYFHQETTEPGARTVVHSYKLPQGVYEIGVEGTIPQVKKPVVEEQDSSHMNAEDEFGKTPEGREFLKNYKAWAVSKGVNPPFQLYIDETKADPINDINAEARPIPTSKGLTQGVVFNRAFLNAVQKNSATAEGYYEKLMGTVGHEYGHYIDQDDWQKMQTDFTYARQEEIKADLTAPPKPLIDLFNTPLFPNDMSPHDNNSNHPPTKDRVAIVEIRGAEKGEISPAKAQDQHYLPDSGSLAALTNDGYLQPISALQTLDADKLAIKSAAAAQKAGIATEGQGALLTYIDNTPGAPAVGGAVTQSGQPALLINPATESGSQANLTQELAAELQKLKGYQEAVLAFQSNHVATHALQEQVSAQNVPVSGDHSKATLSH